MAFPIQAETVAGDAEFVALGQVDSFGLVDLKQFRILEVEPAFLGHESAGFGDVSDKLCAHLMKRYEDGFGIQFEFLIYDVTSTFFLLRRPS